MFNDETERDFGAIHPGGQAVESLSVFLSRFG